MKEVNSRAKVHAKLLKEREIKISDEADKLMRELQDSEVLFLHRKLIRPGKIGDSDRNFLAQEELYRFGRPFCRNRPRLDSSASPTMIVQKTVRSN